MESTSRSRSALRRALVAVGVAVLAAGSLTLLPRADATADGPFWPYTRIAESARVRAGLSTVQPGDVAVIRFSLGSYRGSDIFVPGAPVSVEIGCASRTAMRENAVFDPTARGALDYDAKRDVYTFHWVTSATWADTCQRLRLQFADGSAHDVLVWFGEPFGVVAQAPLPR
ncbi:PxKF domain-containing protein [Lysobacter korlensis]|uniref:PxKF domain-containing protein n=1 Tax=Lysobacter korlensis TaxID=553636 RepID=A0ABV6RXY7_9GAMM